MLLSRPYDGRGVNFIEWNCKSLTHRSYQRSCHLGRRASSTGQDLLKKIADARGALGVTPKVSTASRCSWPNPARRSPELRTIYPI